MPGIILKLLNLTTSNLKQPNLFIEIKNLPPNLTEVDPGFYGIEKITQCGNI